MSLFMIVLLGLALARLNAADQAATAVPDDVWAAFEASLPAPDRPTAVQHAGLGGLNTVGGMAVGEDGHVSARAAAVDLDGRLWLASAAVVHPAAAPGRVAVRRTAVGYHLQRVRGVVGLWDCGGAELSTRARVPVEGHFD